MPRGQFLDALGHSPAIQFVKTHAHMVPRTYTNNRKFHRQIFHRLLHTDFQMALTDADDVTFDRAPHGPPHPVPS